MGKTPREIRRKSQKQEERTAKEFSGRAQPGSGALYFAKADVRTGGMGERTSSFNEDDFLIENKFTDKDTFKLDRTIWEKIVKEAISDNFRTPLMQVDIQDTHLVILDYNDFLVQFEEYDKNSDYEFKELSTKNKSYLLKNEDMCELSDNKYYRLRFLEKGNLYKRINLIIMLKDTFLSR